MFQDFGKIDEIIIPKRRNKLGNRFGFVRFFEVEDEARFVTKMDNIFVENKKLFVNIPRFHRHKRELREAVGEVRNQRESLQKHNKHFARVTSAGVRDVRTYARVVKMQSTVGIKAKHQLFYEVVDKAALKRFNAVYVGRMVVVGSTYNIQDVFDNEGYFGIKIIPLGARLCLLEERGRNELHNLVESGASWLNKWFEEITRWKPGIVDEERVTWVRAFGFPCNLCNEDFFKFIAKPFGVYIRADDDTTNQTRLDVARFFIRTS